MQHFLIKCQIYIIVCIALLFTFRYHVIGTFARLNAILLFPCDDSKNGTFKLSFLILPVNKYCNKIIIVGYLLTCMNWYVLVIFYLYFCTSDFIRNFDELNLLGWNFNAIATVIQPFYFSPNLLLFVFVSIEKNVEPNSKKRK